MSDEQDAQQEWAPPVSKEEFDRIIENRIARERKKFSDYADLKKQVEGMDEAIASARKEAEDEATNRFTQRLADAETRAIATTLGFHDPSDAVRHIDLSKAVSDGGVDVDSISAALTELVDSKPYLVQQKREPRDLPRERQGERISVNTGGPKKRAADALRSFAGGR